MKKMTNRFKRVGIAALGLTMACSCLLPTLSGCEKKKERIVIMTEELSGLFNPFYATSGSDMDVVGMTQLGMLSTEYDATSQEKVKIVAGDDKPTVVKAYNINTSNPEETVYTFVIKNNLKFSDGKPLTMNDVMFNIYEYLDPVYTGSSTMYSIDIVGLSQYRTQTNYSAGGNDAEDSISATALASAQQRLFELIECYQNNAQTSATGTSYYATEAKMIEYINDWPISDGYKDAVATVKQKNEGYNFTERLLEDYKLTLKTFKDELKSDYKAAKESYDLTQEPYKEWESKLKNDVFKFLLYEGYITPEYEKVLGKDNKSKIIKFNGEEILNNVNTEEKAIERVYKDKTENELNRILSMWGTAGTLRTLYTGAAKDVLLHNNATDGKLPYPNIEGIKSLGHTGTETNVIIDGTTYKVAHSHNDDGTPANSDEYDVLQIRVNGVDPKAIYNFSFSVAPVHYYTASAENPNGKKVDIANDEFGVEYASSNFQQYVIQSQEHQEVPLGAGTYKATDVDNNENPSGAAFWNANYVYFKANDNFMFDIKADKLCFKVVSSTNALDSLENNEVDYITPQFTLANSERLKMMKKSGYEQLSAWQLGYGYIGINAGKVPNHYVRKAIMSAMNTKLSLEYYAGGTCKNIDWPMSTVNWAYPYQADGKTPKANNKDYTQWVGEQDARAKIQKYMNLAGVTAGSSELKLTFTIAGASITEHPTYGVFKKAAEILNDMGWEVTFKADSQALTKLSTGALEVWAAAWGSTIDPDMYQVYHKRSSATSVYAWGYREILSNPTQYPYENDVIGKLSDLIDDGRATLDMSTRTGIYEKAMSYVLDLAVELPVYQRMTLYAYNSKTIKGLQTEVNPYSNPLERIWELEMIK